MKDPACRVAPERGGPSRKRRPSPSSASATKTPAHPRRPQSVEDHRDYPAAQRPNKNGILARRDAAERCGGKQSDDKAVAPTALRRQSKRRRVRRPHGQERGKSARGSAQKNAAPSGAHSAGQSASLENPAHSPTLPIVTRRAKTTGLVRVANRAGCRQAAPYCPTFGSIAYSTSKSSARRSNSALVSTQ